MPITLRHTSVLVFIRFDHVIHFFIKFSSLSLMASFKHSSWSIKSTGKSVHTADDSVVLAGVLGDPGEGVHLVGVQVLLSFPRTKASKLGSTGWLLLVSTKQGVRVLMLKLVESVILLQFSELFTGTGIVVMKDDPVVVVGEEVSLMELLWVTDFFFLRRFLFSDFSVVISD